LRSFDRTLAAAKVITFRLQDNVESLPQALTALPSFILRMQVAPSSRQYHCHRHPDSNEKQNAPKNNSNEPLCRCVVHLERLIQRQKTKSSRLCPDPILSINSVVEMAL
jgi:hypothetical protein